MIKNIVLDWHGVLDAISPMTLRHKFIKLFLQLLLKGKFSQAFQIILFSFDSYSPIVTDYAAGRMSPKEFWKYIHSHIDSQSANLFQNALMEIRLNTDLIKYLGSLNKKYNFYILSDCPKDKKQLIEKNIPSTLNFTQKFYSCDFNTTKREKTLFTEFLKSTGLNPAETLFIDDSCANTKIASKFGFQTLCYKTKQPAQTQLGSFFR
jgi:FMN phosphatase YigB (HAD superfamily)